MKMNTITIGVDCCNPEGDNNYTKYKIFDNVTNEFSDMKYLVCREYCSKETIVGSFNSLYDAEAFCNYKNTTYWKY